MQVKYRSFTPGLNPRRTKLEVPGWGGERQPRKTGSMEQAWHCLPFSEGARYGIELFYPYENELRVSTSGGKLVLEGNFGPPPQDHGGEWPPFRTFGNLYYTYQLSLDLKVEEGWAIRTEPHPRFYTDPTDTTPIAIPALVRRWWPMIYFLVFKSPPEGKAHIFGPASHSSKCWSCRRRRRSISFRCRRTKPPSASCRRDGSIRAAAHYRPGPNGNRPRTPCSTERIDTFSARRKGEAAALIQRSAARRRSKNIRLARSRILWINSSDRATSNGDDGGDAGGGGGDDDGGDGGDTGRQPSAFRRRNYRPARARPLLVERLWRWESGPTTRRTNARAAKHSLRRQERPPKPGRRQARRARMLRPTAP